MIFNKNNIYLDTINGNDTIRNYKSDDLYDPTDDEILEFNSQTSDIYNDMSEFNIFLGQNIKIVDGLPINKVEIIKSIEISSNCQYINGGLLNLNKLDEIKILSKDVLIKEKSIGYLEN